MKSIYLSGVVLVCLAGHGYAQLSDTQLLNADALTADLLNSQIVDLQILESQLLNSQGLESQILDTQLLDAQMLDTQMFDTQLLNNDLLNSNVLGEGLINGDVINDQLDQTVNDLDEVARKARGVLEPVLDPLTQPVTKLLESVPLDALANSLPIVTRTGATAFVDVQVEEGWRAVEREWLITLDKSELAVLQPLKVDIIEQTDFAGLQMVLVRFRVPAEWDSLAALKQRLPTHLHEQLDRNHIYAAQADNKISAQQNTSPLMSVCSHSLRIGMIDTAINTDHSAFAQSQIIVRDFLGEKFDAPRAHGTAVAGLLVGSSAELKPLLPNATLYAASVFYPRNQYAQGATMMDLVRALNWLADEKVSAINMSLAGPDNQILRSVIARVIQQGIAVIAAAGNEGPAAPAMYPAAYVDVIAATAVDRERRVYRWANRGDYIDFAALGVSVTTTRSEGGFGRETGTSIAAPVVSAFVACALAEQQGVLSKVIDNLAAQVTDLGDAGRDSIFGLGLLEVTKNVNQNVTPKVTEASVSE